jgi:hypothetical protein
MSEGVVVAIITAIPPTIAAVAAWWQVQRMRKPLEEVNAAVNHRAPGERRMVETVNYIAGEVSRLSVQMTEHDQRLRNHLAFHQEQAQKEL